MAGIEFLSCCHSGARRSREPGIHRTACFEDKWIPGSRYARPGMTTGLGGARLPPQKSFLDRLDLEREGFRIDPALREAAGDEPQARLPRARIHVAQLEAFTKAPDRADAVGHAVAEQLSHQIFLRLVASGKYDQIGGDDRAVVHSRTFGDKSVDVCELLQLDRAFGGEVG